jgi:hypothetical protein
LIDKSSISTRKPNRNDDFVVTITQETMPLSDCKKKKMMLLDKAGGAKKTTYLKKSYSKLNIKTPKNFELDSLKSFNTGVR